MQKQLILLGCGGHARVLLSSLRRLQWPLLGVTDPKLEPGSEWLACRVLGDDSVVARHSPEAVELVNGIGSLPRDNALRRRLFEYFVAQGFAFKAVVDPAAWLAQEVELATGVQVMAGAIIQAGAQIAENCIINSGAVVEHDCRIAAHVHVSPAATLCGAVSVGEGSHVGAASVVLQGVRIGKHSIIGAGSIVTRDVADQQIVYPARSRIDPL